MKQMERKKRKVVSVEEARFEAGKKWWYDDDHAEEPVQDREFTVTCREC